MKKSFVGFSGIALTVFLLFTLLSGCTSTKNDSGDPYQKEFEARLADSLRKSAIEHQQKVQTEALASADTIVVTAIKASVTEIKVIEDIVEGGAKIKDGTFSLFLASSEAEEGEEITCWAQELSTAQKNHKKLSSVKPEQFELTYVDKQLVKVRVKTTWQSSTKATPGFDVWKNAGGWQLEK